MDWETGFIFNPGLVNTSPSGWMDIDQLVSTAVPPGLPGHQADEAVEQPTALPNAWRDAAVFVDARNGDDGNVTWNRMNPEASEEFQFDVWHICFNSGFFGIFRICIYILEPLFAMDFFET